VEAHTVDDGGDHEVHSVDGWRGDPNAHGTEQSEFYLRWAGTDAHGKPFPRDWVPHDSMQCEELVAEFVRDLQRKKRKVPERLQKYVAQTATS